MADSYSPKADADADEHNRTSSKRSRTRRTVLEKLVMDMLPTHGPGMSPVEVTERLEEDSPAHTDGLRPESLKTEVRTILREMWQREKCPEFRLKGGVRASATDMCDTTVLKLTALQHRRRA